MAGPALAFQTGDHSSRPAASAGCVLYSCTDHNLVYRSDGSSWSTLITLASGLSNPMTTAGDIIQSSDGSGTPARLALGSQGSVLRSGASAAEWQKNNLAATAAPDADNDVDEGYTVGSAWFDTTNDEVYFCIDNSDGAAVWKQVGSGSGGITEHAYVTGTSTVTVSSTSEASPTSIITTGSIDVGSGAVDIEFGTYSFRVASGDIMVLNLWEDSTDKGRFAFIQNNMSGSTNPYIRNAFKFSHRYTPGSGSKTFSIRGWMDAGSNGLVAAGAGGSGTALPMFLRITSAP